MNTQTVSRISSVARVGPMPGGVDIGGLSPIGMVGPMPGGVDIGGL